MKNRYLNLYVGGSLILASLILWQCRKPVSSATSGDADKNKKLSAITSGYKLDQKGWTILELPETYDSTTAYWKGMDTKPKAPILPVSAQEQKSRFILRDGYSMDAVLTEPQIEQPGAIAFDGNGRMYVLELRSYMLNADSQHELEPTSGISRWEDKDNDGIYETGTMFVNNLVFPRFVLPFGPDCILTMESNQNVMYKYTDTDGDGHADKKELFYDNYGRSGNVEHQQSSLYWGMDNWLYSTVNPFRIRWTPNGVIREATGSNHAQWGITHDDDGKLWFQGGSSGVPSYWQFPVHYGDYTVKTGNFEEGFEEPWGYQEMPADFQPGMRAVRQPGGALNRVTGAAGNDIFRGDRLPKELYGEYFYGEPVARIVRQVSSDKKGGLTQLRNPYQKEKAEFISSSDPLFRPVDMTTAPDGSMYITDMYHGIIQEGEWTPKGSYLRAKVEQYQLDKVIGLGRIWRLTHKDFKRDTKQPRMYQETSAQVVKHLEHPNGWWRDMAQQVLVLRQDKSIVPELEKIARSHSRLEPRFHALWVLEGIGELKADLVKSLMRDPQYRMRNAAMWVSETLYKNGDKSFDDEYRRLMKDSNEDVIIRAMMTAKLLKVPNIEEDVKNVMAAYKAEGIQLVGQQILQPQVVHAFFGRTNPNHTEEEKAAIAQGQKIYTELCSQCHGLDGRGTPVGDELMAPSFVGNKNLRSHPDYVIKTILRGVTGAIDGKEYEGVIMVPMAQNSDEWVSQIASFIRAGFENEAAPVSVADVKRVRAATENQKQPYQYKALKASVPDELIFNDSWIVTASHSELMRKGGTGKPAGAFTFEGWTTGVPQSADMYFTVQFPGKKSISELQFKSKDINQGNFRERQPPLKTNPRYIVLEYSDDGKKWKKAWEGATSASPNVIRLEKSITARYLRMRQTGTDEKAPWIMENLTLFGFGNAI
jgi:mono/diheme cytochrome c family protein